MNEQITHTVVINEELAGLRLDQALSQLLPDYSRSVLSNWIRNDMVLVDGKAIAAKTKVKGGEQVTINAELAAKENWQAQAIDLDIIYEDTDVLVINKPAGLVVHPAAGNPDSTLVNALLHHDANLANLPRGGLIHRIDKDTTGLLLIAKTLAAHTHLIQAMQAREIARRYLALVNGEFVAGGTVDEPIGRHPRIRTKMAVVHSGKPAITHYRIKQRFQHYTLLDIKLETGRTHQIRVHMAHINHPLVGDQTYAGRLQLAGDLSEVAREAIRSFKRQALHAYQLSFKHPIIGKMIDCEAPLPDDFANLLKQLKNEDA